MVAPKRAGMLAGTKRHILTAKIKTKISGPQKPETYRKRHRVSGVRRLFAGVMRNKQTAKMIKTKRIRAFTNTHLEFFFVCSTDLSTFSNLCQRQGSSCQAYISLTTYYSMNNKQNRGQNFLLLILKTENSNIFVFDCA